MQWAKESMSQAPPTAAPEDRDARERTLAMLKQHLRPE